MSGLAQFLLENKAIVTGSDLRGGPVTSRLNRLGARVYTGHSPENLDPATEAVVVSAAVNQSNPELQLARRRGCRIFKYAQLLGKLMSHYDGIAVGGTHGKSTTSGWLVHALKQAGIDVNFVVGADILQLGSSSGSGDSGYLVAEACEYDRSFLNLKPTAACILNIERDHLDCYKDEDDIVESFHQFARGTRPGGLIVANGEDRNVARVLGQLGGSFEDRTACVGPVATTGPTVVTFGLDMQCNFCARNLQEGGGVYRFDVFQDGRRLGPVAIALPGLHNVYNALAVIATAVGIGIEPERILRVMDRFTGMDRRLMLKGQLQGVTVLDDYAHHPTEIRASLRAIRERYRPQRLWCVFQAHQYSRTHRLLDEFAASFAQADRVIVPEIYFVRDSEASRNEVNAAILAERIRGQGTDAEHIPTFDVVCQYLERHVRPGDLVVAMGAGDVWKVADEYIQRLGRYS